MTTTDPDQIRHEIERTRTELSDDVDALSYKVSPRRMVGSRVDRVRGTWHGVKERVMGTASDVGERAAAAPDLVREKAEGSPLAVGLVAFGVGMVVSSLLPPTRAEQRMAGQVRETVAEHGDELKQKATEVGQEMKEHLQEPAQRAVDSVKATAGDAAQTVKGEAQEAKDKVVEN
jgi:hypothetical protein